jgi:hypothetical protein
MRRVVPGRKPVVLVVEDENLIRLSALDMVEEAGFVARHRMPMKPSVFWKAEMTFARSSQMFTCPAPWTASGWRALLGTAGLQWL